ncbi:HNH endonuclease [Thalassotalea litorea]|uniref:HNH endonuclease n=1 Tax=Thalassotalea litorea TaxID=2020715 RepID=A0A5R9IIG0_9GAMM|nr:HNH endonuclease [Thalassotalea litorea]TLU65295.1 HNH endonuclease [Thalassotalea litorea]
MTLAFYNDKLQSLRPNKSSGRASPHKICMMFAVMDLIEQGYICDNRIHYDETLKRRFSWHFVRLKQGNDTDSPFLPFYHLKTSGFWHLNVSPDNRASFDALKSPSKSPSDANMRKLVNFAYLDDALFEYLKSPNTAPILRNALTANLDTLEVQYGRWAKSIGKSEKTINNYVGALKNSIPNWLNEAGLTKQSLLSIGSYVEYENVVSKTYEVREFVEKDKRGKGMYSAAIRSYRDFLSDITQADVQHDIDEIILDKNIPDTQKTVMVNTRIGQGRYREELISHWQGCAVTKFQNYSFLIASHIKPWANSDNQERLDPFNGLLLLANIDKAFDLGYISFNERGHILISEYLEECQTLGIHKDMNILLVKQHQDYLAYHRENKFRR